MTLKTIRVNGKGEIIMSFRHFVNIDPDEIIKHLQDKARRA